MAEVAESAREGRPLVVDLTERLPARSPLLDTDVPAAAPERETQETPVPDDGEEAVRDPAPVEDRAAGPDGVGCPAPGVRAAGSEPAAAAAAPACSDSAWEQVETPTVDADTDVPAGTHGEEARPERVASPPASDDNFLMVETNSACSDFVVVREGDMPPAATETGEAAPETGPYPLQMAPIETAAQPDAVPEAAPAGSAAAAPPPQEGPMTNEQRKGAVLDQLAAMGFADRSETGALFDSFAYHEDADHIREVAALAHREGISSDEAIVRVKLNRVLIALLSQSGVSLPGTSPAAAMEGEAIREAVLKKLATMGFWDHSRNAAAYDRVDEAECVAKSQELASRDQIPLHEALACVRQQQIVALLTEEDAQSLGGAEAWASLRH